MNSTTLLYMYENQTTDNNLSNTTNYLAQRAYLLSSTRFFVYNIIRLCQVVIGIPANIMTLIVINRLRFRLNMHIVMVYMVISDISSSATLPMGIYLDLSVSQKRIINFNENWDTFCIFKIYFDTIVAAGSMVSYFILSVDR